MATLNLLRNLIILSVVWTAAVQGLPIETTEASSEVRGAASPPSRDLCSEPPQRSLQGCTNGSTVDRFYFAGRRCTRFQTCITDVTDNVTMFDTQQLCEETCQAPTCILPPKPSNGFYDIEYRRGKIMLWYSCNSSFHLDGTVPRVCMYNNTWNVPEPTCRAVTCPRNDIDSRVLISPLCFLQPLTPGCKAYFTCNDRSMTPLCTPRKCQTDGTWSDSPYCAKLHIKKDGTEVKALTIGSQSQVSVQLHCGVDPYLPHNAIITWKRQLPDRSIMEVPDRASVKRTSDGGSLLTFPVVQPSYAGTYVCQMRVNCSEGRPRQLRKTVTLSVKECRNHISTYGTLTTENTMILQCQILSCRSTTLKWYHKDLILTDVNVTTRYSHSRQQYTLTSELRIDDVPSSNHSRTYRCTGDNGLQSNPIIISTGQRPLLSRRSVSSQNDKNTITFIGKLIGMTTSSESQFVYRVKVLVGSSRGSTINVTHNAQLESLMEQEKQVLVTVQRHGSQYLLLSVQNMN